MEIQNTSTTPSKSNELRIGVELGIHTKHGGENMHHVRIFPPFLEWLPPSTLKYYNYS